MNLDNVIFDLVEWMEKHLDTPLSLDIVAARSGYSKWHLQRLFKEITGCRLGQYIRGRRLSRAAMELRMTRTSILNIALKYHFDTQQTFSRAFKRHFRQSPAVYRNRDEWDCSLLYPPLQKAAFPVVAPTVISLPRRSLVGMTHSYTCPFENMNRFDMAVRGDFWWRHFRNGAGLPECVYGLSDIGPYDRKNSELEITYTTAVDSLPQSTDGMKNTAVLLQEGDYIQFDYAGPAEGLQRFIIAINQYHLPRLKVVRRKGADIERYDLKDEKKEPWRPGFIHCSYFVPCANAGSIDFRSLPST